MNPLRWLPVLTSLLASEVLLSGGTPIPRPAASVVPVLSASPAPTGPVLTECVADNDGSLLDGYGEASDWIEVYNPGLDDVDLAGWSLRDSATRWTFPPTRLPAGAFLVVFASDRQPPGSVDPSGHLHAHFKLDAQGETLSLLRPDGTTASEFSDPGLQIQGRSYGLAQLSVSLSTFAWSARIEVPSGPGSTSWNRDPSFDDSSWIAGQASAGYGTPLSTRNGTVAYRVAPDTPGNQDYPGALGMDFVATGALVVTDLGCFDDGSDGLRATIRVQLWRRDDGGTPSIFADDTGSALLATVTFTPGDPGALVEGSRFKPLPTPLTLPAGPYTIVASGYGPAERNGNLGAGSPGEPWETRSGGDLLRFVGAARYGTAGIFPRTVDGGPANRYAAGTFRFAGDVDPWVRTPLPPASRTGNPSARMRIPFVPFGAGPFDSLQLRLAFDDGCVAWLNGVEVARRFAPPNPGHAEAATTVTNGIESIALRADLLVPGTNLLALQGFNAAVDDDDFLMAAELRGVRTLWNTPRHFSTPTPGAPNPPDGVAGFVKPPRFGIPRGFQERPFDLHLTRDTPGATLRFTRDGSAPSSTHGQIYTGPLRIDSTTVIRAIAVQEGLESSPVETHSYLFADQVAVQPSRAPSGYPPTWTDANSGASVVADYGMIDPQTQPARYARAAGSASFGIEQARAAIAASLRALPILSVTTDPRNLFDPAIGIYLHPGSRGEAWERPVSVECLTADGSEAWQADAGLHVMGLTSRSLETTPKLNFMLVFAREYGDTWLREPFFGPDGPRRIKRIALRSNTRDGWLAEYHGFGTATYLLDGFAKDSARDSGEPATRHRYVHLFLNGLYWGVYNPTERPESHWAETTFGGEDEDYDVVDLCCGNQLESGSFEAWRSLLDASRNGFGDPAAYQAVQGNDPQGHRDPALRRLLGVDSFIGFAINGYYHASVDWPGNFFVVFDSRADLTQGWRFVTWDTDLGLPGFQLAANKVTPPEGFTHPWWQNSPGVVDVALRKNPEYRLRLADRVFREFFHQGAYGTNAALARWRRLRDAIRPGLYAESARWGDYRSGGLRTVQDHWLPRVDGSAALSWFSRRPASVIQQLRSAGLYPRLDPPEFTPSGGEVPDQNRVALTHPNADGIILFTLDGTDPRLSSNAVSYTAPIAIPGPVRIRARVRQGTTWSALHEASFFPPQDLTALRVSEIMYHPPDLGGIDGDEFEFLELQNQGTRSIDLSDFAFHDGIDFRLPTPSLLGPGDFLVLASDADAFRRLYPTAPLHGIYRGRLDNAGETLVLANARGQTALSFAYDDNLPWPAEADASGLSLQRRPLPGDGPIARLWVAAPPTPGGPPPAQDLDSDGDGMTDGWETAHRFDPTVADADQDADGDGLTNGQEHRARTDPWNADDFLRLHALGPRRDPDGVHLVLSFPARSNRTYSILQRRGSVGSPWTAIAHESALPSERTISLRWTIEESGESRLFRLVTPRQPGP